jgi:hypothetical protein
VLNENHFHLFVKVKKRKQSNSSGECFFFLHTSLLADGYYPDRQNCRIYHICTSGVDTAAVCGEGTAWDPIKKNCGWENTVECKKGLRKWDQITDIRGGRKYLINSAMNIIDTVWDLVTLFATDAALAWRAKKKSTTTRQPIKVDSNFTCEYDAEGYFAGIFYLGNIHLNIKSIDF